MDKKIKVLCEILIHEEDDFLVPIKKLYNLIKQEKENFNDGYDNFIIELKQDNDFTVIDILDSDLQNICPAEYQDRLEECGFFQGPYVFMSHDTISQKQYLELIQKKLEDLILSLENISLRTEDDINKTDEVNSLLQRAEQIKNKIEIMKQTAK